MMRRLFNQHWLPALIAIIVGIVVFPLLDATPPMEFIGAEVDHTIVQRGSALHIKWQQDWAYRCAGTSTRTIVTSEGERKIVQGVNVVPPATMGKRYTPGNDIPIPSSTPAGTTEVWTTITFPSCGVMGRRFEVKSPVVQFTVR